MQLLSNLGLSFRNMDPDVRKDSLLPYKFDKNLMLKIFLTKVELNDFCYKKFFLALHFLYTVPF